MAKDRSEDLALLAREARPFSIWSKVRENWHKIYFTCAAAGAIFFYGVLVGSYDIFPHRILRDAQKATADWAANYLHYARVKPEKFLAPARQNGSGVITYVPGQAYRGLT